MPFGEQGKQNATSHWRHKNGEAYSWFAFTVCAKYESGKIEHIYKMDYCDTISSVARQWQERCITQTMDTQRRLQTSTIGTSYAIFIASILEKNHISTRNSTVYGMFVGHKVVNVMSMDIRWADERKKEQTGGKTERRHWPRRLFLFKVGKAFYFGLCFCWRNPVSHIFAFFILIYLTEVT